MPDASPAKWHLAHTAWFFETFVFEPNLPGYRLFDQSFNFLFNSYYEIIGARQPRPRRGMITRPTLQTIHAYRDHIDAEVETCWNKPMRGASSTLSNLDATTSSSIRS